MTYEPGPSLDAGIALLSGIDFWRIPAVPGLGVDEIVMSDGPAGVRGVRWDERDTSINVPCPTALSSSWDRTLVRVIGALLAQEARRKGVHVLLAPTINLHRTPYGGRYFECFSEDPVLTAEIAAAYIQGVQDGGVAATAKHYVANDTESERFTVDVRVDERVLREVYLLPFELLMRQPPWVIMAAYNSVNGVTMTENALLEEPLRSVWGWDGAVVSDWFAARDTVRAGLSGLDIAMPASKEGPWGERLRRAVREGDVPAEAVERKIGHVLRLADRVGRRTGVASAETQDVSVDVPQLLRRAAAEGSVLLKNADGLLPFDATAISSVAVIGPNARRARTLGGGSATVFPRRTVAPLDAISALVGPAVPVRFAPGVNVAARVTRLWEHGSHEPVGGGPGMRLRLLDHDGNALLDETRSGETFSWLGDFPSTIAGVSVAAAQVDAVVSVQAGIDYHIGSAGVGTFQLVVDGEALFDELVTLPAGADPVTATLLPPQRVVGRRWAEAADCTVSLRRRVSPDDVSVSFDLLFAAVPDENDELLKEAVAAARASDVVILVVGTTDEVETEGLDRSSLALPGRQDELVRSVVGANPRTVVVVNSGAPVLLPWRDEVPAILQSWFGGQESGAAIADVIFGLREPGGRLPSAWPENERNLPSPTPAGGVLAYENEPVIFSGRPGVDIAYPMGHGLGYASLRIVDKPKLRLERGVPHVDCLVRNDSGRAGKAVIQLYFAEGGRASRQLVGFAAEVVEAASTRMLSAEVELAVLCQWDPDRQRWLLTAGDYTVECGWSASEIIGSVTLRVPQNLSFATVGTRLALD